MSTESQPISPARFRIAIKELPIGSLHAKAAELRNSIDHLKRSNTDLAEFPDDEDCAQAVKENLDTIERMEERIALLKEEVEERGMRWVEGDDYKEGMLEPGEEPITAEAPITNGIGRSTESNGTARATTPPSSLPRGSGPSGRLTDDQLRALLAERMSEPNGNDSGDEGVHL